eukprot:1978305-Amphidinium_carterae.1
MSEVFTDFDDERVDRFFSSDANTDRSVDRTEPNQRKQPTSCAFGMNYSAHGLVENVLYLGVWYGMYCPFAAKEMHDNLVAKLRVVHACAM